MALEQTYNCDGKTQLFNGITQKPQTIDKYLKALPVMTSVLEQVKTMVHMNQCNSLNKLDNAKKDIELVKEITNVVQTTIINPFKEAKDDLINISNGKRCASTDIANAKQIGQDALSAAQEMGSLSVKLVKLQTFVDKVKKPQSLVQKSKKVYEEEAMLFKTSTFCKILAVKRKLRHSVTSGHHIHRHYLNPIHKWQMGLQCEEEIKQSI